MSIFDRFSNQFGRPFGAQTGGQNNINPPKKPQTMAEWKTLVDGMSPWERSQHWPGMHKDLIPATEMIDAMNGAGPPGYSPEARIVGASVPFTTNSVASSNLPAMPTMAYQPLRSSSTLREVGTVPTSQPFVPSGTPPSLANPPQTMTGWKSLVDDMPRHQRDQLWPGMHKDLIPATEMIDASGVLYSDASAPANLAAAGQMTSEAAAGNAVDLWNPGVLASNSELLSPLSNRPLVSNQPVVRKRIRQGEGSSLSDLNQSSESTSSFVNYGTYPDYGRDRRAAAKDKDDRDRDSRRRSVRGHNPECQAFADELLPLALHWEEQKYEIRVATYNIQQIDNLLKERKRVRRMRVDELNTLSQKVINLTIILRGAQGSPGGQVQGAYKKVTKAAIQELERRMRQLEIMKRSFKADIRVANARLKEIKPRIDVLTKQIRRYEDACWEDFYSRYVTEKRRQERRRERNRTRRV